VLKSAKPEVNAIVASFMILSFAFYTNNKWTFYLIIPLKSSLSAMDAPPPAHMSPSLDLRDRRRREPCMCRVADGHEGTRR
jgi:hypothetical protein